MTTFNDLNSDIIFVIALLLRPADLYNLALLSSKYAQIIKNRKIINYHLEEKMIYEYNENDNCKMKYFVFKHTDNKHGLFERWYSNGQKELQLNYQNGKVNGLCEKWYENGQKEWQVNCRNGKKHGLYEYWYSNGQKGAQINYQNDEKHGLNEYLYSNGQKEIRIKYQNGYYYNFLGELIFE